MSKKKLTIIIVALVIGVIALAIGTSYALFTFNVTKGSIFKTLVGKLELSITDTINEDRIVINDLVPTKEEDALQESGYTFTVTNTGSIDAAYTVYLDDVVPQGESKGRIADNLMRANLTNSKSGKNYTFSLENNRILDTGILTSGESVTYTLRLWLDYSAGNEAQNKYFAARIRIDSVQSKGLALLKDIILEQNKVVTSAPTLTTTSEAANEKGLYKMSVTNGFGGQDGDTYYFRGNVTNNYVNFAGYTWRIVRINEDGTIRLILDDSIDEETYMYNDDMYAESYMYFEDSNAKNVLDNWYQEKIITKGFNDVVATGNYYCQEARSSFADNFIISNTNMVTYSSYQSQFKCDVSGLINSNIGLLTYDEINIAGGYVGNSYSNRSFYLYKNFDWVTMSPAGGDGRYRVWRVNSVGRLSLSGLPPVNRLRPVINLKATTKVTGNGTSTQPYVVVMNEDNNYQVSSALAAAISQFNPSDLKDVIMCDQSGDKYINCKIYNTIEDALADRNTGTIIVTNNITRNNKGISIDAGKSIILELNGKKIETLNPDDPNEEITTFSKKYSTFDVYGNLVINDNDNTGSVVAYVGAPAIYVESSGNVVLNGGTYDGRNTAQNYANVVGNGITLNDGIFNAKIVSVLHTNATNASTIINGGLFYSENDSSMIYNQAGTTNIYDGTFITKNGVAINNDSTNGTLNIYSGTIISYVDNAVRNSKTGTLNIIQTVNPIYIASFAQEWKPTIRNISSGTLNITASQADTCTANASDTTSGLCVIALGDGSTTNISGNEAIRNYSTGTININGGVYIGTYRSMSNASTGTLNIKNARLQGSSEAIYVGDGNVNVCDTIINYPAPVVRKYDVVLANKATAIVNYNNVTFSSGTTTPISARIINPANGFTQASTCPISE